MGGALGRGNFGVLSEFNIAIDPEAATIVFESGLPLSVAPLDVGAKALVYPEDSAKIKEMNQTGDMMVQLFKKYRGGSLSFVSRDVHCSRDFCCDRNTRSLHSRCDNCRSQQSSEAEKQLPCLC